MNEKSEEDLGFVPIQELLLKDNPKVKRIKTLYKREWKYIEILMPIETGLAYYYLENPDINDKDVEKALKEFKDNWDKPLDEKDLLLARIQEAANIGLQQKPLTKHELFLAIDYILWSIGNRSWVPDDKAYLNWICKFFHLLDEESEKRLDYFYDFLGALGVFTEKELKNVKCEWDEDEKVGE